MSLLWYSLTIIFCYSNIANILDYWRSKRRHDIQHNDTQHNDIQQNGSVSYVKCHKLGLYAECHNCERRYTECRYAKCRGAEQTQGEHDWPNFPNS
jgi:hypothetical protein